MKDTRIDYVLDALAIALGLSQGQELLSYIQLGLGILATIVSIAFSIWKWWKKASADGKITSEEIKELSDDLKDKLDDK